MPEPVLPKLVALCQQRETITLVGYPTRGQFRQVREHARAQAATWGAPVCVITPDDRELPVPQSIRADTQDADDTFVQVPAIRCLGRFHRQPLDASSDASHSELAVLWWQADWALPIDDTVACRMAALDWHALARDVSC